MDRQRPESLGAEGSAGESLRGTSAERSFLFDRRWNWGRVFPCPACPAFAHGQLPLFQGKLWKSGYERQELKGEMFEELGSRSRSSRGGFNSPLADFFEMKCVYGAGV